MARRQKRRRDRHPSQAVRRPNELPLPHSTREVFPARLRECHNIGLLFDRYLRFQEGWQLGTFKVNRRDHSAKMFNVEEIVKAQEQCNQDSTWQAMHKQFVARWKATIQSLRAQPFPMSPDWRFVVGLGDKGALEVGLTFHRVYGFPIIPGSALKGVARAAALWEIADELGVPAFPLHEAKERAKKKAKTPLETLEAMLLADDKRLSEKERQKQRLPQAEAKQLEELREDKGVPPNAPIRSEGLEACRDKIHLFRTIFGTLHAAGQAVFLDGVPAEPPVLKPDVMNVHYQDYYSEKKDSRGRPIPPADYLNPNPIPFLTVSEGSQFLFAVGWRSTKDDEAHEQTIAWLKEGLRDLGVGAKTAAGYGYFLEVRG